MKATHLMSGLWLALAPFFAAGCASAVHAPKAPAETPFVFKANSGEEVDAFRGEFTVPENRDDPDSREITLRYVRFPATGEHPGAPIVYLAGGPGGSGIGTAKRQRFPLFMAMREFGDVIAFDQRGTGESDDTPKCVSDVYIPDDRAIPDEEALSRLRKSVDECGVFWKEKGIDIRGYTTVESARDLDALRKHLGAKKITLWGISYGTHLALAAIKEMEPRRLDRVILASTEGLSQTVKLPARTDAYFGRLQAVIDADPKAKALYPDIKTLMRRVQAKLAEHPVMLQLKTKDGGTADFLLQKHTMQMVASGMIADPGNAAKLMQIYQAADEGNYEPVAKLLAYFITPGQPLNWRAMPLAMDVASGISDERLAEVEREAKTALVGDLLNFPMPQLRGALGLDLGDGFRTPPKSDVPVLLLTGTLDGRTYPQSHWEATSGLSNLTTVTVVNAGHNLFMVSPEVTQVIQRFMRGEKFDHADIEIPPPDFQE